MWLHEKIRKKGKSPKLSSPWSRPYLVISILSDVVYRIQKSPRAKPNVVHADHLKPYLGPPLKNWITEKPEVSSPAVTVGEPAANIRNEDEIVAKTVQIMTLKRPRTLAKDKRLVRYKGVALD